MSRISRHRNQPHPHHLRLRCLRWHPRRLYKSKLNFWISLIEYLDRRTLLGVQSVEPDRRRLGDRTDAALLRLDNGGGGGRDGGRCEAERKRQRGCREGDGGGESERGGETPTPRRGDAGGGGSGGGGGGVWGAGDRAWGRGRHSGRARMLRDGSRGYTGRMKGHYAKEEAMVTVNEVECEKMVGTGHREASTWPRQIFLERAGNNVTANTLK